MIAVYYSRTGNTAKLASRLPIESMSVSEPRALGSEEGVILLLPTYSDARGKDAVPSEISHYIQNVNDRNRIKAVVACGDRSFINTFGLGGKRVASMLGCPIIATPELSGLPSDVKAIERFVNSWK